jgi:hypothetical protein
MNVVGPILIRRERVCYCLLNQLTGNSSMLAGLEEINENYSTLAMLGGVFSSGWVQTHNGSNLI